MDKKTRNVLIVGGVLLVVLFVVGTGIGLGGGLPGITVEGVMGSLSGLIPAPAVRLDEIDAEPDDCLNAALQRFTVAGVVPCVYRIAPSDTTVRSLTLQRVSGSNVRVQTTVSPVEGKSLEITEDLPGDDDSPDEVTLTMYKDGGTVVITCQPGGCVLNVAG